MKIDYLARLSPGPLSPDFAVMRLVLMPRRSTATVGSVNLNYSHPQSKLLRVVIIYEPSTACGYSAAAQAIYESHDLKVQMPKFFDLT
jgi:hypothetical protein